ncbi:MAG: hypothetical protein LBR33_05930 [Propionibacteriaceae bacterium]|jgi:homocitrate synthase NifV|nr:hypothetical protein [Propionibacteriaceae bacterium]
MRGLVDTTLREGAQAPVPYLGPEQRRALVAGLGRIGVEEIELGHAVAEPGYGDAALADLVAAARELAPRARRAVWCRARREDIVTAARLGLDVVSFALPCSDLHLVRRLGRSRAWALAEVGVLAGVARDAGIPVVSLGLEDATRGDPAFVAEVVAAAAAAGVDRVRLADTVGVAAPDEMAAWVGRVRAVFPSDIGVHCHDDFGLATANAVAAVRAGADWADVSLLGLGERAGIARTEAVAAYLVTRGERQYDVAAARSLALDLAGWVGRPVPSHAPILGDGLFTVESGLHLAGLAADPSTYEPYPPELTGAERHWRLGTGAGRAAVTALLPETTADPVGATTRLRHAAAQRGRSLTLAECREVLNVTHGRAAGSWTDSTQRANYERMPL